MNSLSRIPPTLKTGKERLKIHDELLDFSLLDFWRWSASDILSNSTRGRFAEFIVATAARIDLSQLRDEWSPWDLETPDNIKIEVKSSAYLQSWHQRKLSTISFSTKASFKWDSNTATQTDTKIRSADVYVFCLLRHLDKATCDPLNINHWEFYVLATKELNEYTRSQSSITLNSLKRLTKVIDYENLHNEIQHKNSINNK